MAPRHHASRSSATKCAEVTCAPIIAALSFWAPQSGTQTSSKAGKPGAERKRSGYAVCCRNSQTCKVLNFPSIVTDEAPSLHAAAEAREPLQTEGWEASQSWREILQGARPALPGM